MYKLVVTPWTRIMVRNQDNGAWDPWHYGTMAQAQVSVGQYGFSL